MDTNIIYNIDCVAGMNQMIDEESIDLIIADPPYFKVIGEKWDYLWRTEEDYLEWSEKWIAEAARVLRMGGSFYLFGYFRMLSRLLPILEKYGFELRQTSVYKGYKQDKIEMRGDRAEMSDFPLYLNMVAGGLDCRDQAIGGFSFVVKIYAVPVVEIIG